MRGSKNIPFAISLAAMLVGAFLGAAGDLVTGGLLALIGALTAYAFAGGSE